jgi:threonine/homoserine/homoserine lactone efflux protein
VSYICNDIGVSSRVVEMPYLQTFAIGLLCAMPFGPMGILCLRRVMQTGVLSNLTAIFGIAAADASWAFITVNGLRALSSWTDQHQRSLGTAIGVLFIALGVHGFLAKNRSAQSVESSRALAGFIPNFVVVFFNPSTCVYFSGVFAVLGIGKLVRGSAASAGVSVTVFLGVTCFWLALGATCSLLRGRLPMLPPRAVSRMVSVLVSLLGVVTVIAAWRMG